MRPAAENQPRVPRRWQVGTLTYTAGGLAVLFCWLLWGDFAWQLKERSVAPIVQIMLRKFEASDFLTGVFLLSLPSAIGLLLGPVISYRSDRHRGRWGRRIPYLLLTTPFTALAMYGLAFSPVVGGWVHARLGWPAESRNVTIIVVMGLCWTLFELATITANAVFGALINDVVPREIIGRFFGLFRAVSLITGMIFNFYLIGHAREYFMPIFVAIGTAYGIGFALMCFRVKEGGYPPAAAEGPVARLGLVSAIRCYARDCFSRSYYLWVFAWLALATLAFVPVNLYSVYAAESFGLSMAAYGKYLVLTYACSLLLAWPLGWLADRLHPIRVGLVALAAYGTVMAAGFFGIMGPASFGAVFLAHGILAGCYGTGAAAIGQMLFPKLKFAQFASAAGLISALGSIVFGPVLGLLLDRLGRDYHYTFGVGGLLGLAALAVGLVVYRRFTALGGPTNYVAPE
ncbi:MAG: MFS transporter [Opitutales bacterium]|nr:MFS transporter [Opitutales bacterium]